MTADELADLVVALLNDAPDKPIEYTAVKPAEVGEIDAERDDCGIYVVAEEESEEPIGDNDGTSKRTRSVAIVVNGPVRDRPLGDYLKLSEFARRCFEGTQFDRMFWQGNDVVSTYDRDALKNRRRFLSLCVATYDEIS